MLKAEVNVGDYVRGSSPYNRSEMRVVEMLRQHARVEYADRPDGAEPLDNYSHRPVAVSYRSLAPSSEEAFAVARAATQTLLDYREALAGANDAHVEAEHRVLVENVERLRREIKAASTELAGLEARKKLAYAVVRDRDLEP